METFEFHTRLTQPRDEVFEWFTRPGALVRLWPPFGGRVLQAPSDGINPGSTAAVGVTAPGAIGMFANSTAAMLPGTLRPEIRWEAKHVALDPTRSFTDEMVRGPLRSWRHVHTFDDDGSGTSMLDHVTYELPRALDSVPTRRAVGRELARIFAYRSRQLSGDLSFNNAVHAPSMTVAVTGASGLIGTQVCALLSGAGHTVRRLVRHPARTPEEIGWDPDRAWIDEVGLASCDAVVHLAGHPIGGRFTEANKRRIMDSRRSGTGLIARALAGLAADGSRRTLVSASAIGYYGAGPHAARRRAGLPIAPLDEDAPPGDDFLARVCQAWEEATVPARDVGVRVVNLRTGLVLSPAGGLLTRFLPLYLAGVGGPLGRDQWLSWIGIDDMAAAYAFAVLTDAVEGPINAVAPEPVTALQFATALGRTLHRPSLIPVPAAGPRLLLGAEGAREMADADQRVSATKLQTAGFSFRHPELAGQLGHVLGTC